jgi:hypothetical protein
MQLMKNPCERHTVVFIVRLWAEYLNQQPPSWRGVIEGREPGQGTPFTNLDEMNEIIQKRTYEKFKLGKQTVNSKSHKRGDMK